MLYVLKFNIDLIYFVKVVSCNKIPQNSIQMLCELFTWLNTLTATNWLQINNTQAKTYNENKVIMM